MQIHSCFGGYIDQITISRPLPISRLPISLTIKRIPPQVFYFSSAGRKPSCVRRHEFSPLIIPGTHVIREFYTLHRLASSHHPNQHSKPALNPSLKSALNLALRPKSHKKPQTALAACGFPNKIHIQFTSLTWRASAPPPWYGRSCPSHTPAAPRSHRVPSERMFPYRA